MNTEKRKKLEAAGWKFGEAADFLGLTEEERAYVALKLGLARKLAKTRKHQGLTQKSLATKLHTSQPRVAMMEKGDTSVTLDLLIRALLALGTRPRQLAALL